MDWWARAANIASVVESLFVAVSAMLIVLQLRKQTKLTQAANSQAAFELSSPFNLELIRDKDFARLWFQGPDSSDSLDQFRHESLVVWWLLLHENIFYQWKRGLLEDEAFLPWKKDLQNFASRADLLNTWPKIRAMYQAGFTSYVEKLLSSMAHVGMIPAPNPGPQADA